MLITKPGVYAAIPIDTYIRDDLAEKPSLSSGVAHLLLTRSAQHAFLQHPRLNPEWTPDEPSTEADIGSAVHALLLEDDSSRIHVVDAANWRTSEARGVRMVARENGVIPLLTKDRDRVEAIVQSAKSAIRGSSEIAAAFAAGLPEQTYVWQEGESWCRTRPDWVTNDARLLIDVKTTSGSAEPDGWARGQMLRLGYDTQLAFQLRAVKLLHQPKTCSALNMIIEVDPPFAVSFVGLSPEFEDFAERKRQAALERWRHCLETGVWPGFPSRICWASPPAWALTQWEEIRISGGSVEDL